MMIQSNNLEMLDSDDFVHFSLLCSRCFASTISIVETKAFKMFHNPIHLFVRETQHLRQLVQLEYKCICLTVLLPFPFSPLLSRPFLSFPAPTIRRLTPIHHTLSNFTLYIYQQWAVPPPAKSPTPAPVLASPPTPFLTSVPPAKTTTPPHTGTAGPPKKMAASPAVLSLRIGRNSVLTRRERSCRERI